MRCFTLGIRLIDKAVMPEGEHLAKRCVLRVVRLEILEGCQPPLHSLIMISEACADLVE
jgi:hypothetical protein